MPVQLLCAFINHRTQLWLGFAGLSGQGRFAATSVAIALLVCPWDTHTWALLRSDKWVLT